MTTVFEVDTVFRIINAASPALTKILAQVRELTAAVDRAKASLAALGKPGAIGLGSAITETDGLAMAWKNVAKNATEAGAAMTRASAAARSAIPAAAGGGGRGALGARLGIGGSGGSSAPHFNGGHGFGTAAIAGAGLLGYGVMQAMNYDDAVVLMAQHAGVDLATNRAKFRKMLTDATQNLGFDEHAVAAAAQQELRMFGDTGGSNGVDVLPKMLRYAATEARLKGTSLEESMSSLTGLSHMLQKYGEADVDKIAPAFSALSVRNPMSLAQQERAFGYAVPLLQSSLGMDPFSVMAGSTALARAGITNTKGGTWIRELAIRAMPGTSLMSKMAYKKHEEALKAFGLVDDKDRPTWFTDGHGDFMKLLDIASANAAKIPMEKRASYERQLFGAQGSGALAVLSEPAVRQQMGLMSEEMRNPANVNRVRNFMSVYNEDSSLQRARTAIQTFNVTLADIGEKVLPAVNHGLQDFKGILETLQGIPHTANADAMKKWGVGTTAIEGMAIGAAVGSVFPGVGTVGGAALGAITGAGAAAVHDAATDVLSDKKLDASTAAFVKALKEAGVTGQAPTVNMHTTLNIDGQTLAQALVKAIGHLSQYQTDTPASNGGPYYGP